MIAAIVLAAGQSSRMGAHKLLLPLGDSAVIAHVADAALASRLRPVVVVLGHGADDVRQALPLRDVHLVANPHFAEGLSTSLRAGLDALPVSVTGVVIALGDQPGVTPTHFDALAAHAAETGALIIVSTYAGRRGNPVYFARTLFDELRAVAGDNGGREIIARHPELVRTLPVADTGTGDDLDTPDDYKRLLSRWQPDPRPRT
jgi:molybdenum cofactor cytidylyltransferase